MLLVLGWLFVIGSMGCGNSVHDADRRLKHFGVFGTTFRVWFVRSGSGASSTARSSASRRTELARILVRMYGLAFVGINSPCNRICCSLKSPGGAANKRLKLAA